MAVLNFNIRNPDTFAEAILTLADVHTNITDAEAEEIAEAVAASAYAERLIGTPRMVSLLTIDAMTHRVVIS